MAGIAKITLVGNLGRDPETRYTPNGKMNVTFTMAVSRRFNDQSGQQQERTNWYRVTAWGGLAETLDRMAQNGYLAKGQAGLRGRSLRSARVPGSAGADANLARRYRQRASTPRIPRRWRGWFWQWWFWRCRGRGCGCWAAAGPSGPGGAARVDRRSPLGRWRTTILGWTTSHRLAWVRQNRGGAG